MRRLTLVATVLFSLTAQAVVSKETPKTMTGGTTNVDEQYVDELKTIKSGQERNPQTIDYNSHTYSGQNSQVDSKEDDQQRMEEAHKYLQKQKVREGTSKGTNTETDKNVWPQEH